jgi:hypothetical protein
MKGLKFRALPAELWIQNEVTYLHRPITSEMPNNY